MFASSLTQDHLLFSDHGGPAVRAPALDAGYSALMGLLVATLRADAVSVRSGRQRAAANPPATLTPSLSASHSPSALSHSVHDIPLSVNDALTSESAAPSFQTTRHGKGASVKVAGNPCPNHIAQISRNKGNHPDAATGKHSLQRPGNGAANQHGHTQLCQAKRLLNRQISRQRLPAFPNDPPGFRLDDANLPRGIEYRRDSIVPERKGSLHFPFPCKRLHREEEQATCHLRSSGARRPDIHCDTDL